VERQASKRRGVDRSKSRIYTVYVQHNCVLKKGIGYVYVYVYVLLH